LLTVAAAIRLVVALLRPRSLVLGGSLDLLVLPAALAAYVLVETHLGYNGIAHCVEAIYSADANPMITSLGYRRSIRVLVVGDKATERRNCSSSR